MSQVPSDSYWTQWFLTIVTGRNLWNILSHFFKFREKNFNIIIFPPALYPSQLFWCDLMSFGDDCLLLTIMEFSDTRLVVFKMPKMSADSWRASRADAHGQKIYETKVWSSNIAAKKLKWLQTVEIKGSSLFCWQNKRGAFSKLDISRVNERKRPCLFTKYSLWFALLSCSLTIKTSSYLTWRQTQLFWGICSLLSNCESVRWWISSTESPETLLLSASCWTFTVMLLTSHRLHLLLKMETWMWMSPLVPRCPQSPVFPLNLESERSGLLLDRLTAEAGRARGVRTRWGGRGEEAGPDHSTGEPLPSQSTWTNCLCPQTALRDQSKPKLRVTMATRCKWMQKYVSLRRAETSAQSNKTAWRLQTTSQCARQPQKLNAQKMLQTLQAAGSTVEEEGVLTDPSTTPGPLVLHTTTGTGEVQEAGEGPITCTAEEGGPEEVTAGASSTRWSRGRGEERRCYDKGRQEGQWTNVCVPPSSNCID